MSCRFISCNYTTFFFFIFISWRLITLLIHHFCGGGGGCARRGRECMGSFVLPLSFALDLKLLQKKS